MRGHFQDRSVFPLRFKVPGFFFYSQWPQRYAVSPPIFSFAWKLTNPLVVSTKCSKGGQSSEIVKIVQVSWKQFLGRGKWSFPCHDCQKSLFTVLSAVQGSVLALGQEAKKYPHSWLPPSREKVQWELMPFLDTDINHGSFWNQPL